MGKEVYLFSEVENELKLIIEDKKLRTYNDAIKFLINNYKNI